MDEEKALDDGENKVEDKNTRELRAESAPGLVLCNYDAMRQQLLSLINLRSYEEIVCLHVLGCRGFPAADTMCPYYAMQDSRCRMRFFAFRI
ncbi:MAG: hypothetical protein KAJ31_02605 [Deltaproteobacteria bacterium]|nr:hypothetical protein [Deltaproteobacteria bacterium]MCK5709390.1 hypothetical protein [Deltaproteobacteria bacterium]